MNLKDSEQVVITTSFGKFYLLASSRKELWVTTEGTMIVNPKDPTRIAIKIEK